MRTPPALIDSFFIIQNGSIHLARYVSQAPLVVWTLGAVSAFLCVAMIWVRGRDCELWERLSELAIAFRVVM